MADKVNTSYKGVSYRKQGYGGDMNIKASSKRWNARLYHNGAQIDCGYYATDHEAAKARDKMIIRVGSNEKLQVLKPINKDGESR